MASRRLLQAFDLAYFAATVTLLLLLVLAVPSFLFLAGWLTVKYGLFVAGFLLFGYALFRLRPVPPYSDREKPGASAEDEDGPVQRFVNRLPPLADDPLPPDRRFSGGAKLFVTSLLVLLVSYLMEAGFGVAK